MNHRFETVKVEEKIKSMDLCLEIGKDVPKVSWMGIQIGILQETVRDILKGFSMGIEMALLNKCIMKQIKIISFSIATILLVFFVKLTCTLETSP